MSMGIMYKRYGEVGMTPAEYMAKDIFAVELERAIRKEPRNLLYEEVDTTMIIKPLEWDNKNQIHALVAPLSMPICDSKKASLKEATGKFVKTWKSFWGGKSFDKFFCIEPAGTKEPLRKETESFFNWKKLRNPQKLAFIYQGYFWIYKDNNETLNQAAERFFEAHQDDEILQGAFRSECKKNCWEEDKNKYIKAILNDGALLFNRSSNQAVARFNSYSDPSASVWAALAIKGYFRWITQVNFISSGQYEKYLK